MTRRCAVGLGQAVRAQVEELLAVDLGDGRRVGAAHVVGQDLEARDRVGVGALGEQQVARLLEGVGALGARVDLDHPAPHRAGAVGQDAAEGEVARGVGRRVLLQRVEVEVLAPARGVGAGDAAVRAGAGELGLLEDLAVGRAEAERDPVQRAVAADDGALRAEDPRVSSRSCRSTRRRRAFWPTTSSTTPLTEAVGGRARLVPDRGLRVLLEDHEQPPVQRGAGLLVRGRDDDRRLDRHAARHVDEGAVGPVRVVARDERGVAGDDRAQVALDELRVLLGGLRERHDDRALGRRLVERRTSSAPCRPARPGSASRSSLSIGVNSQPGVPRKAGSSSSATRARAASRRASRVVAVTSANRALHLQLDQAVHLDRVLHRQLLDDRLDEAVDDELAGLLLVDARGT